MYELRGDAVRDVEACFYLTVEEDFTLTRKLPALFESANYLS